MSDQAVASGADVEGQEGDGGAASAKKKWSGKRIVLFIVLPLLVVLGGAAAGVYFTGLFGFGAPPQKTAE